MSRAIILWLNSIFVIEEYRGKGVATKLLQLAEEFAKQNNSKIELSVWLGNDEAFNLYKKLGYKIQRYILEKQ
ncbi:MAG: GNAT family N-acetyltransferase [Clostridia bacterium]|nr:GNAT family N-acetyltransferase [Clostridia bacterium]